MTKAPAEVTVGQVLRITEGSLVSVACLEDEQNQCDRSGACKTLPMWNGLYKVINDYLDGITLQDILDQYNEYGADSYVI